MDKVTPEVTVQILPVGPSGPVQDPAVIGNFLVLCLFFIEFNERLLRSAIQIKNNNINKSA